MVKRIVENDDSLEVNTVVKEVMDDIVSALKKDKITVDDVNYGNKTIYVHSYAECKDACRILKQDWQEARQLGIRVSHNIGVPTLDTVCPVDAMVAESRRGRRRTGMLREDAFTDTVTANPTWQMINRICNDYGYKFDPYARVNVDKNGRQTLQDIRIWPMDDDNMPNVEISTSTTPFKYTITTPRGSQKFDLDGYEEYVKSWQGVVTLIEELNEINFYDLYQYFEMD